MRLPRGLQLVLTAVVCFSGFSVAHAADKVRIAVAHRGLWDTGVSMIVGERKGFFAKEGLDVDLRYMRSAPEIIQTMIVGENDVAIGIGILAVIGAYSKGAPIRIISAEMTGSEYFWYARASSPINSLKDLGGRTLGHNAPGSAAHLAALALKDHSRVDVKLVMAGRMSDNLTQVLSGQIDVGYGLPPVGWDKLEQGQIKVIAVGSDIPSLRDLTSRVNAATAQFAESKRDVLTRLIRARTNAIRWMFQNREESAKIFAEANKIEPRLGPQVFKYFSEENLAPAPIKGLNASLEDALRYKFLREPLTDQQVKALIQLVYAP